MPGKQKDSRTRVTIAMERELERKIKAEVERRKKDGVKADQSGIIAEAIEWYLKTIMKLALVDASVRFLCSFDPVASLAGGFVDAGLLGWWGVKAIASGAVILVQALV